ncbi:proliferation marker protein Ki-67 [Strix uralensis]|uniref:proliferation marker protein Ki-67 n=1 Tax=Strix uralensis TaxID=36305 RepID=UPI003DA70D2F
MPLFGNIIVIKRNGTDGISFPLTASSCLFGRRTECDIRIQLPQVSKEHCKIEVNENKEAILTNLSTVNPTQLNGGCFQQPVPLKHGDVLTIIDRSFRFEYPLQSTPRKKRSRSPKDETLQVLHVQQVAEVELLHKQTSGSKSLHASDNAECEEKNANENKQSTEEKTCKALPVKLQTPKSAHGIHLSSRRQSEMSPFSKLYEKLKCEIKVKKTLQEGNVCQQAAKEDGKTVLLEPSARTSSSCVYDLGSLTKEKERSRSENIEECKIKQEVICSEFNQISAVGSATRKSFTRSPRTSISKETPRDAVERNHLQDRKELSTEGSSKSTEVTTKSSKENDANAAFPLKPCIIECLDCADKIKIHSSPAAVAKLAQMTNTINVSEVDKYVLSTPTSRRRSPRSHFISATKETSGVSPVYTDTPTTQRRVSLKCKSFSEILAETQREDSVCGNDSLKQLPLAENECLKQRRNSKQRTPGRPVKEEVLKEICDQANFVNSKEECSETPVSLSNSKSPRRSNRQSKELSNTSVHLETPAAEELTSELSSTASPKSDSGRQRGRPRTSGLQTEKALETSAVQEHPSKTPDGNDKGAKEDLATKGHHQKRDLEDACDTRPRRLSFRRRSSGSAAVLKGNEAVSEMNVSGLLAGGESGKTKMLSQKRKSGGLLLQPLEKRKRVSFGGHLSPELFDKSLPPNSPIKRGAIPARLSLPFGNSPRAVLKKAQGLKRFTVQELSEHLQKETMSPKHLPAWKSPAASSPASGKATPTLPLGSPALFTKGRFSVSHITTPSPIAEEKYAVAENVNTKEKNDPQVKTPKSSHVHQDDKTSSTTTPDKLTKSAQVASKVTPMRRSGAVAVINAKRRSGASSANLLVAKSWAEVVKLGVARSQSKTVKKSVRKGSSLKKKTKSPKTPERKIKGHFSTGHAESPATIVVGRAYSTTVRTVGQVPKVVKNPIMKLNVNMDESFTGIAEMFQTPENKSGKTLPLASVQKTDFTPTCTAVETSELQTPEESGEMMVSPLNSSDASEQKQDSPDIFHFQIEESVKCVFDTLSMKTPENVKAILGENVSVASLSIIPEKQTPRLKSGSKRRTPKQKSEPVEDLPGIKQLRKTPKRTLDPVEALSGIKALMRTPKRKPEPIEVLLDIKQLRRTPKRTLEPVEALSGIKELMRTPKRKPEPTEVLSGIKQLMKTPKQKPEPIEVLSGIKQLMKTPKSKPEPIEDLSGIKQLMKTPKSKPEPIEDLSGIKQLMKTPKRKPEPIEDLSGIKQLMKTPKSKPEPIEDLSGIKQIMKTPKRKPEPIEDLSGIKQLMKTPKQKPEPIEVLSGIKQLMKTPKSKPEPIEDLSGIKQLMKTPKSKPEPIEDLSGIKQLMKTPKRKPEPIEDLSGIKQLMKTPKSKPEPIEDLSGIKQIMKTPKRKPEPIEDLSGIKELMRTPKQKPEPIEVLSGIKKLMRTPKQKPEPIEVLSGIKELMRTPKRKPEPIEVLSGIKQLMKTPQQELEPVMGETGFQRLLKTPAQEGEAVKDVAGVTLTRKTPKLKCQPVEDMIGVSRIFKTPEENVEPIGVEPIEDIFDMSTLVKAPREKYQPADDFVGLQRLMAEPKQKCSNFKVDYVGLAELFEIPEETKVGSGSVPDSEQEDTAPPCTNSSHKYEDKGNVSQSEDSQQRESTSEDDSTQRPTKGRSRKTKVHPASAKQCEKNLNSKELQSLEKKSTQEEMEEISTSTSAAKNRGRGRRANRCIQEEIVSQHPDPEEVEIDSFVEGLGATRRAGRGKGKKTAELKHAGENLESCGKASSVVQKQRANRKQTLQEYGFNGILETEDDPAISSSIQNENCQLQTGLKRPENKPNQGGVEDSEEMLLWPRRSGGIKEVENTESLIPPKGAKRARNNPIKQASSQDLPGTRRQLRKGPSAKIKGDKQTFNKDTKTATAEKSESGTKFKIKITEKRLKSLRSARKHSTELKADICEMALENLQNIPKIKETSTETGTETQSHIKNEIKVSQGDTEEALSGIKELMRTPKRKPEPTGVLLGIKQLRRTPKRKVEPVEALSGIKELMRTPKRKPEPIEVLSGIKQLMKTPQQELEPVMGETGFQRLLKTPAQEGEAVKDVAGVTLTRKTPKLKCQPVEDMIGVSRIFKTPEENVEPIGVEPIEDIFDMSTLVKAPREKYQPADDFVGLQRLMAEPKQKCSNFKVDYVGLAELFEIPEETKVGSGSVPDSEQEDTAPPCTNSSHKYEDKGNVSQSEDSQQRESTSEDDSTQRPTKGRSRKTKVHPASAKQCEKNLNSKELQSLEKKSTQEEMEEISTSTSAAKNRGRGRRANRCIQEEIVSQHPDPEEVEIDSFVEGLGATRRAGRENPLRRGKRREVAAASQTSRSLPVRRRHGLPEGDDKKTTVREDQNPALGNKTLQVKRNASARGARKKIDLAAEAGSSSSLQRKFDLSETDDKEEGTNEEQNMSLETVSCAKEKPLGRGRRKETALASHTTNHISLRGKRRLPADNGREAAPKEYQNVPLETFDSPVKENQLRRGRRKDIALSLEATSSIQGKQGLSKESSRKKKLILDNPETPEEQENILLAVAPSAKGNPSRVGRKRRISSKSEETTSAFLRENPALPINRCQKGILKKQEVNPIQQATSSSRRRKCELPSDDLASKKSKSENDENGSLQKGRRNKAKEQLGEEGVRATRTTGGTDRKTRSSTRTSARARK